MAMDGRYISDNMNEILAYQNVIVPGDWGSYDHFFRELLHGICWKSIMTSLTDKKDAGNVSSDIYNSINSTETQK